jgi:hypothetical protein
MRLTLARLRPLASFVEHPPLSRTWAVVALAAALLGIVVVDRLTGVAPVQHLYYLPIIYAAIRFGGRGGLLVSMLTIVLYHVANPHTLTFKYEQSDVDRKRRRHRGALTGVQ